MKRVIFFFAFLPVFAFAANFGGFSDVSTVTGSHYTVGYIGTTETRYSFANQLTYFNANLSLDWARIASGKPTTLAGYGIADAQPLDSDLTSIAALATTAFGRSVLTSADAAAFRSTIGAGTSSFDGAFASLSSKPTTFQGYGVTDGYLNLLDFNTAATSTDTTGRMRWNNTDKCVEYVTLGGVVVQIGQETLLRARNATGSSLLNGKVVYISGATGDRPTVALANANLGATSDGTIGVITTTPSILNGEDGFVTLAGLVRDLDTSSFTEGSILYLSDSVAGGLTITAPTTAGSRVIRVGHVAKSHATQGMILVDVDYSGTATGFALLTAADAAAARTAIGAQASDADLTTWAGVTPGTGVATALAVNVGTAGSPVVNGGALGTPSSGTLTNCTFPTLNQSTTGNAATATALATARTINGVSFDGTANITVTAAGSTLSDTVTVAKGGTGLTALGTGLQVLRTNSGATAMEWATISGGGDALVANPLSQFAATTSAQLRGVLSDESGTGEFLTTNGSAASLTSFPTFNQNTTGSAATLTTARAIYGNNFDGSAALTQVIASTYGGTGNGFTKFTGPLTAEKTFTLPNASATVLTDNAAVTVAQGGTGLATLTANNVILGNGTSSPLFVAPSTSGNVLTSNGTTWVSSAPSGSSGDVTAAAAFGTDNRLIRSDGTGKGVQTTGITVDDSDNMTGVTSITATTVTATALSGTATLAGNPTLSANGLTVGTTGFIFEGATADTSEGLFTAADPTADRTWTLPDADTVIPIFGQTVTFSGPTAARTITLPDASFTAARTDAANTFTGTQTIGALVATTVNGNTVTTGSGTLTLGASKTLTVTESATLNRQSSTGLPVEFCVAASDETTAITTGTAKATFRAPYAFTITAVRASVTTAPTGSTIIIDINDGGTTIMTTDKLSIDASEKTSTTAATAAAVTDTAIADDAEITIDFDQVGSTVAGAGVKIWILGYR